MDKNTQRKIWNENHGYKGKSRKWAYRRSTRAIKALREAGLDARIAAPNILIDEMSKATIR